MNSTINWTIIYVHTCWFGVGMGQWGAGAEGIWTIHCAECEPMPDQAGGISGRGLRADGAAAQVSGMLRRARENQAPVGSPLSVGEDDPDLARGESHPLPGRGSEGPRRSTCKPTNRARIQDSYREEPGRCNSMK